MIKRLIALCLKNRVLVLAAACFLLAAGIFAFENIPIEAFPDVSPTQVNVITQLPGAAPEEVEKLVTLPIERAMNGISGMTDQYSTSMFALSSVTLTFADGVDNYFARDQVIQALQNVTLPSGVQPSIAPLSDPLGEVYRYILEPP
ncbi:MAG: efflux RND transporter permease subunit, partial [Cyanobacteria bacterium REEB65]|nr:efflux RND transporter permease subunit [Cyanobacteria bacterium REEB65]